MNTKAEIDRLTHDICELMGLTLGQVVEVQVDLASDYLKLLVERGWLAGPEDAQLMVTIPEFWGWWRQRWANQDRQLLDSVGRLKHLGWAEGVDMLQLYRDSCYELVCPKMYPNDVITAAFLAEKQKQNNAFTSLKNLFTS